MPDYCNSCPYNKYCKGLYISVPTCPMGHSPVGSKAAPEGADGAPDEKSKHVLKTEILLKIAKTSMNRNDYQNAVECYEKVLSISPDNTEASFLLKRAKYMVSGKSDSGAVSEESTATKKEIESEPDKKSFGMLAQQQQIQKVQIKPKQQFEINPNIIGPETDKVYGVEKVENVEELEDVSKHVAIRSKGSVLRKRGVLIAFGLSIAIIVMIVVGLYMFGFLQI